MIKLEVEDYCHKCTHFDAGVVEPIMMEDFFGKQVGVFGDYIIQCANRDICKDLLNRVSKERGDV